MCVACVWQLLAPLSHFRPNGLMLTPGTPCLCHVEVHDEIAEKLPMLAKVSRALTLTVLFDASASVRLLRLPPLYLHHSQTRRRLKSKQFS